MKKKTNPLLLSVLALCICTVLVVGATYALFSDSAKVGNHLQAGSLDVGLYRTSYVEHVLGSDGLMTTKDADKTRVDLTKDKSVLFDVQNAVPTSWYEAELEVSNLGSVAFEYGVRILWTANSDKTDNDELFASQIKITVNSQKLTAPVEFMLNQCADYDVFIGSILAGAGVQTFSVRAEFANDTNNNSVMLATLDFDVQVYATQKTA